VAETRDRTNTAQHAPPRDAGMPAGQAPAARRPMTAVERRKAEEERQANEVRDGLFTAMEGAKPQIESFLGVFGISYELFSASLTVFLSKQQREQPDFFVDLHIPSFIEALTRIAMNGLLADGKEAAIAAYKNRDLGNVKVAQPMFMRDGFVKVLWRTGLIKSINDQVVTEAEYKAGRFRYVEGDNGFVEHEMDLMRKDTDPIVAAYCVIRMVGGEDMREVVPKDELDKMAQMSRSPARRAWQHQMHRKGAIRRIMGKMPREKAIAQLLQHDDDTYDRTALNAPAADAPDHGALFSNRPIRRRGEPKVVSVGLVDQALDPATRVLDASEAADAGSSQSDDRDLGHDNSGESDAPDAGAGQGGGAAAEQPFALRALLTKKNGVQVFDPAHPDIWYGDIQQRMKVLDTEQLQVFWVINRPFIEEAGQNGFGPQAMKLIELATEMGLIGVDHGR
jgi:recombinational DNA repair protein RecT